MQWSQGATVMPTGAELFLVRTGASFCFGPFAYVSFPGEGFSMEVASCKTRGARGAQEVHGAHGAHGARGEDKFRAGDQQRRHSDQRSKEFQKKVDIPSSVMLCSSYGFKRTCCSIHSSPSAFGFRPGRELRLRVDTTGS
jgi:hypothetical protein